MKICSVWNWQINVHSSSHGDHSVVIKSVDTSCTFKKKNLSNRTSFWSMSYVLFYISLIVLCCNMSFTWYIGFILEVKKVVNLLAQKELSTLLCSVHFGCLMIGNILQTLVLFYQDFVCKSSCCSGEAVWQNLLSVRWHKMRRNEQEALHVGTGQVDCSAPGCWPCR